MNIKNILSVVAVAAMTAACSDTWDDHYQSSLGNGEGAGSESLLELIEKKPELGNFLKVAKVTHLYNNMHSTSVTYADLLASDQTLTVWAPVLDDATTAELLAQCETQKGDSVVGLHFMSNHIAHNLYNMNSQTDCSVRLFNSKMLDLTPKTFGGVNVSNINEPAKNGLLHVVDNKIDFAYNVYEAITSKPELIHVGEFFARYERQELDEDQSVKASIEDGKIVYSDSVIVLRNDLFRDFENINSEDSSYCILVPPVDVWQAQVEQASKYFNYGMAEKADSLQDYWVHRVLMSDLVYNKSRQRADSVFFTSYSPVQYPYHTYQDAYSEGGPLWKGNITDSIKCSNGTVYMLADWPYTQEQLYLKPIVTQAERDDYIKSYNKLLYARHTAVADSVSGNAFMSLVGTSSSAKWEAEYRIFNTRVGDGSANRGKTLSGKYEVCAVILPKTVDDPFSRDFKPNQFQADITFTDANGKSKTVKSSNAKIHNDPYRVDTVVIETIDFPVCEYDAKDPTVTVTLKDNVGARDTGYSHTMYLDCIYLRPVIDKPAEANKRKEDAQ